MTTPTYPRNAAEIVATLAELLEHQDVKILPEILRASQSRIEHTGSHARLGVSYGKGLLKKCSSFCSPLPLR
jgi:hypothetical protein